MTYVSAGETAHTTTKERMVPDTPLKINCATERALDYQLLQGEVAVLLHFQLMFHPSHIITSEEQSKKYLCNQSSH